MSDSTPAATATIAKSPWRRANSSIAAWRSGRGKRTSARISPGSSVVVKNPRKKSEAAIVRSPSVLRATISASSSSVSMHHSAAGSACATEPPNVPRERIGMWPTSGAAAEDPEAVEQLVVGVLDLAVDGEPADAQAVAVAGDVAQLGDAGDVDERRRPDEPEVHHRHEALAAGEQLGVLAQLAEPLERVLDGVDAVVLEAGRLHRGAPASAAVFDW